MADAVPKTRPTPILPPIYLGAGLLAMLLLNFLVPIVRVIAFPGSFLGLVPIVIGTAFNLLADRAFKRHGPTVKPFEQSTVS